MIMGYFLNVLRQGQMYDLNGEKIVFIQKVGRLYYFYVCKYNEWTFKFEPTEEKTSFTIKEINYIKRAQNEQNEIGLRKIGRDKVFPRN